MIFKEFQDLVEQAGSRYALVIAVTKRARDLKDGAPSLLGAETGNKAAEVSSKTVTIATKELVGHKIVMVNNSY